jgi:hypothetical protein
MLKNSIYMSLVSADVRLLFTCSVSVLLQESLTNLRDYVIIIIKYQGKESCFFFFGMGVRLKEEEKVEERGRKEERDQYSIIN